jgi:hypothetical protein
MKNSILKLKYLAGFLLMVGLFACEGPPGADGLNGTNGTNGVDGQDGADGNANVTIVNLAYADITWTSGSYLGRTANIFDLTEPLVTQDIIDHGTVLGFYYISSRWWALPFYWETNGGSSTQYVQHSYALNTISLYAYSTTGVLDPNAITQYRFLLITDNTIMTKSASSGKNILEKLGNAGVDVNSYYELMDYFGLEY